MPKSKTASAKTRIEKDEEEVVASKPVRNGKTNGKVTAAKPKIATKTVAKKASEEGYAPNPNSQRDFIMRAMKRGGSAEQIKARAARFAAKRDIADLGDPKAYRHFDVSYFAKFLKTKGFDVDIDEESDNYTLNV